MTKHFATKRVPSRVAIASALAAVAAGAALTPNVVALAQGEGASATQGEGGLEATVAPLADLQERSTAAYEKSEVVYATLTADGKPKAAYVVNGFDVTEPGRVVDYGAYSAILNMTSENPLGRLGEATSFEANEGTVYYQGALEEVELPWTVALSYQLDGRPVEAEQLADVSGEISIHMTTARNEAVTDSSFYDSFVLQVTFTFDGDACRGIEAEGATVANSGQDRTVAFTVLPGHEGDFTVNLQADGFAMEGVQVAALPYSSVVEMPDTDGFADGMRELASAVSKLDAGASQLADGAAQLADGGAALVDGSAQVNAALAQISAGLGEVDADSLEELKDLLDPERLSAALEALKEQVGEMNARISAVQQGQEEAIARLDYALGVTLGDADAKALNTALDALAKADPAYTDAAIAALKADVDELARSRSALQNAQTVYAEERDSLVDANELLVDLKETTAQLAEDIDRVQEALDNLVDSDAAEEVSKLVEDLLRLVNGMSQLSSQYGAFHEGLVQYVDGVEQVSEGARQLSGGVSVLNDNTIALPDRVSEQIAAMTEGFDFPAFEPHSFVSPENRSTSLVQFVLTTEAIAAPEEAFAPAEEAPEPTVVDRFLDLFR